MISSAIQLPQHTDSAQLSQLRDVIVRGEYANPALQRLQARILKSADASDVITSYDRMHHRHNRS